MSSLVMKAAVMNFAKIVSKNTSTTRSNKVVKAINSNVLSTNAQLK